jgi:hypothetical protein
MSKTPMTDTTKPAPLNQREMAQFISLSMMPTLERALARLRWLEAENAALKERLAAIEQIARTAPELNPNNYDHEEVCALNDVMIELYKIVRPKDEVVSNEKEEKR